LGNGIELGRNGIIANAMTMKGNKSTNSEGTKIMGANKRREDNAVSTKGGSLRKKMVGGDAESVERGA